MADNILTIVVDGREIPARRDQTVIQAALDAGLHVPYLCYYPSMKPYGACRMCVVEVEGSRGTPASCTLPVADGMVVHTSTPTIQKIRKDILELLVSEHPHGCLTCHRVELCGPEDICLRHVNVNDRCVACPKNERCELKDTIRHIGVEIQTPFTYNNRGLEVHTGDPFYDRDYNLCIVCGRCVRACEEIRGDNAIAFVERAGYALVGTSVGASLLESGCEFCGACIDVCPVGALVETDNKWSKAETRETTVCNLCSVGCEVRLEVDRRGKIIRTIGELEGPANRGQLCFKGKFGLDYPNHRDRLRKPLIRREGQLEEATWDEALSLIAEQFKQHTGSQFALIADARGTNEENYLAQKFARTVMGTNNVDHSSNLRPELVTGLADTVGVMAATNPIWDLESSGCILVVGANVTEDHNVVGVPIKRAVRAGTKLVVIDPREVELTRYADLWIRPRPGADLAVIGGILRAIAGEGGEVATFAANVAGLDDLKKSLEQFNDKAVTAASGVSAEEIQQAARLFSQSGPSAIVYALDNLDSGQYAGVVHALGNLALLTGNVGNPGGGLYPLRQGANEQGSWDVGCVPSLLPGYAPINEAASIQRISEAWDGASIPTEPGVTLRDILSGGAGDVKAAWVIGALEGTEETLSKLDFLVVQDTFRTDLAEMATVVLPAATFAEEEGTLTNIERRVQPVRKVLTLKNSEARPDWRIICDVAAAMGASGFDFQSAAQVLGEIGAVVPEYRGITWSRLSRWQARIFPMYEQWPGHPIPQQLYPVAHDQPHELQWPCPSEDHDGTPVLEASNPKFAALELGGAELSGTKEHPLLFVPGRVLHDAQRSLLIESVNGHNEIRRAEVLALHPADARALKVKDGDLVLLETDGGRGLQAVASIQETAHKGTASATTLFGSLMVELEKTAAPDKMAHVNGLVIRPAKVTKA